MTSGLCPGCHKPVRHRTITPEQCADRQLSEAKLQERVLYRARKWGWKVAHAGRGQVSETPEGQPVFITPMAPGWPDLFLLNPRHDPPRLAIELKREQGELEPGQIEYLHLLNECGIPAVVVRPSDLREGRVAAILR